MCTDDEENGPCAQLFQYRAPSKGGASRRTHSVRFDESDCDRYRSTSYERPEIAVNSAVPGITSKYGQQSKGLKGYSERKRGKMVAYDFAAVTLTQRR